MFIRSDLSSTLEADMLATLAEPCALEGPERLGAETVLSPPL